MGLRVGITGHRHLSDATTWRWVLDELERILAVLAPGLVGVTALAEGADRVFAQAVCKVGGSLHVFVPFAAYRDSFQTAESVTEYDAWLGQAERVERLETPGSENDAYVAVGRAVVDSSDALIAVWDGRAAAGPGGTAEVVGYARARGRPVTTLDVTTRTVRNPCTPEAFYRNGSLGAAQALPAALAGALPFESAPPPGELQAPANELAIALALPDGRARVVMAGGDAALRLERALQTHAWHEGDRFRSALHSVGIRAYAAADRVGWDLMSGAFASAEALVHGPQWRRRLADLSEKRSTAEAKCIGKFVRAAQQAWTRAARWAAVLPEETPSIFDRIVDLARSGARPIGWIDGALIVLAPRPGAVRHDIFLPAPPSPVPVATDTSLFLATGFANRQLGPRVADALAAHGYHVLHGPLGERDESLETQLGRRIRRSAHVVAVLSEVDRDFGLPYWIEQELEYAVDCGRPAALVVPTGVHVSPPAAVAVMPMGAFADVESVVATVSQWVDTTRRS